MSPFTKLLITFCASAVLIGCASTPEEAAPDHLSWQQHSAQLMQLSHWRAKGKIAIRTSDQSESGSLIWQQTMQNSHISLSGPLGLGATLIQSDGKELLVTREGATRRYDISSDKPAIEDVEWDLPLSFLSYWIKGLPSPHSEIQSERIEQGLWRELVQDNWTVTLERYSRFQHHTLPTRLTVERGDTRARLIISNWTGLLSR